MYGGSHLLFPVVNSTSCQQLRFMLACFLLSFPCQGVNFHKLMPARCSSRSLLLMTNPTRPANLNLNVSYMMFGCDPPVWPCVCVCVCMFCFLLNVFTSFSTCSSVCMCICTLVDCLAKICEKDYASPHPLCVTLGSRVRHRNDRVIHRWPPSDGLHLKQLVDSLYHYWLMCACSWPFFRCNISKGNFVVATIELCACCKNYWLAKNIETVKQ